MVKQVRQLRDQFNISPKDIYNFDEVRIYASPQDLNSQTLEFSSVRDLYARKIQNPKESYTGIVITIVFLTLQEKSLAQPRTELWMHPKPACAYIYKFLTN